MPLIASTNSTPPIKGGTYHAICYSVIDFGTQTVQYLTESKQVHQVRITWEIPQERIEIEKDGQKLNLPRVIGMTYTLSTHEKSNLGILLTSWRGKPFTLEERNSFDVFTVLGANCLLTVINKISKATSNPYHCVASASKLMPGMEKKTPENPILKYSFNDDGLEIPEGVYSWMQDIIKASVEYQAIEGASQNNEPASAQDNYVNDAPPEAPDDSDSIPF